MGGDGEAAGHSSLQRGSVGKRAPGVAGCGIISRGSGPSAGARCAQSVLDAFVLQALVERRGGRDRRSREHENGEEDADARDQSGPPRTAPRRFRACRTHEQFIFSGQGWEGQAGVRENSSTASISVRASARAVRRIGHPGRRVIDRDSRMDRREYDAILGARCVRRAKTDWTVGEAGGVENPGRSSARAHLRSSKRSSVRRVSAVSRETKHADAVGVRAVRVTSPVEGCSPRPKL